MLIAHSSQYLGRIWRASPPPEFYGYHYATVEPLLESDAGGSEWRHFVTDAAELFPKRGLLHWHDAPSRLEIGDLWQFAIDAIPEEVRGDRPEYFQIIDAIE